MLIRKITTGFVIQTFDTETKQFTNQEFIAADQVEVEDVNGNPLDEAGNDIPAEFDEYLPFEMVQPPL